VVERFRRVGRWTPSFNNAPNVGFWAIYVSVRHLRQQLED